MISIFLYVYTVLINNKIANCSYHQVLSTAYIILPFTQIEVHKQEKK